MLRALTALILTATVGLAAHAESPGDRDLVERMAREHAGESPTPTAAATTAPRAAVESATVVYADLDGTAVSGHISGPREGDDVVAGVIVIHEWWGLNDNVRAMSDRLAGEGYLALAVDLYEGESASDRDGARELMMASMGKTERLQENLRQAHAYLENRGATKIGSIGWCFGGGWSLRTGLLLGDELDAAVIYYGRVVTKAAELASLEAPVLGLFGALDRGIPVGSVHQFEAAMGEAGKSATIHVYDGADHAFANPSGSRYNAAAAEDAWEKTLAFFATHLKGAE